MSSLEGFVWVLGELEALVISSPFDISGFLIAFPVDLGQSRPNHAESCVVFSLYL